MFDKTIEWRDDSVKVAVLIADAPPHGLGESGDGFPDEDPIVDVKPRRELASEGAKFLDILGIVRAYRDANITIYSVACEPAVSTSWQFTRDFYMYCAECTDGKFLPLASAELLPKVIVGSVKQQIAMEEMEDKMEEEMEKITEDFMEKEGREPTDEEVNDLLAEKFKSVEVDEIDLDSLYKTKPPRDNIDLLLNDQECPTLKEFKAKAKTFTRMSSSDMAFLGGGGGGGGYPTPSVCFESRSVPTAAPPSRAMYSSGPMPPRGPPLPTMDYASREMEMESEELCLSSFEPGPPVAMPSIASRSYDAPPSMASSSAFSAPSSASMGAPMKQEMRMKKSAVSRDYVSKVSSRVKRKKAARS
jgi:acylphosphatase